MTTEPTPQTSQSADYQPPALVVLGTLEELTQLGTGSGAEAFAQGSAA